MRKFSALAVVSLLALTGCAAPTVVESAPATVTVTATPEAKAPAVAKPTAEANPDAGTEKMFYEFVITRSETNGSPKDFSQKETTAALHAFCEDGTPFKISSSKDLNRNMDAVSDSYCDLLDE